MTRYFYILFFLPLLCVGQQLQKTEVRKVTDMTSVTSNTIKSYRVDSSLYTMSFIDSLQADSIYIIKIRSGGWGNEIRYKFTIVRTISGFEAFSQTTTKLKGIWGSHAYSNTSLTKHQVDSLRKFEIGLLALLKRDDYCQDSQTSFDLTISGKTKSFTDDMCKFGDPGSDLEKLLFNVADKHP